MDLDKVLSIQVDDPIPFMQLLAKSDSGITEVREQKLMMIFQVFLSCQILLVIIDHGPQTLMRTFCETSWFACIYFPWWIQICVYFFVLKDQFALALSQAVGSVGGKKEEELVGSKLNKAQYICHL